MHCRFQFGSLLAFQRTVIVLRNLCYCGCCRQHGRCYGRDKKFSHVFLNAGFLNLDKSSVCKYLYYEFCKCIEIFFNHTTFSSIFIHYSKSVVLYSPVFPFAFSSSCKAMSTKSRRLYSQDKIIRRLRASVRLRNLTRLHPNGRLAASYTLILFS